MSDLPGLPRKDDQPGDYVLPTMRGFPCHVETPMLGESAPEQGMGVGWANSSEGPKFLATIIATGGFAMTAILDYARYRRLCENLASIGRQAMLAGNLDAVAENDPLAALEVALVALEQAQTAFRSRMLLDQSAKLAGPISTVRHALFLEAKDETA